MGHKKHIMLFIEVLIALSLLLTIEMIMSRIGFRLDMTPEGSYSLSLRTREILDFVERPLKIRVFVKKEGEQEQIRSILEQYRSESPLVEYELINMDRHPGLAQKYNVHSYYTTVLEYDDRREKTGFPWEHNISNALSKLLGKENTAVWFVTRSGEIDFSQERGDEHSFDFARMRLIKAGYNVRSVVLKNISKISGNPRVIVITGPQSDYDESEIASLREFIHTGGRILFFLDPVPLPNLEKLLGGYGILLPRKLIVDREGHPPEWDDWTIVVPFIDRRHPIAMGIDLPGVFPFCRPVELKTAGESSSKGLLATGKTSWSTSATMSLEERPSFNPDSDTKGPITVGAAREIVLENGQTARILVYGNSSFFDNTYIKLLGNGKLFTNTIHWATREDIVSGDTTGYGKALSLSSKEFRELQIFCFLLPSAVMLFGCIMALKRRRR